MKTVSQLRAELSAFLDQFGPSSRPPIGDPAALAIWREEANRLLRLGQLPENQAIAERLRREIADAELKVRRRVESARAKAIANNPDHQDWRRSAKGILADGCRRHYHGLLLSHSISGSVVGRVQQVAIHAQKSLEIGDVRRRHESVAHSCDVAWSDDQCS